MTPNISDKKVREIASQMAALVDGLPVGFACHILEEARVFILDSCLVDKNSARFKSLAATGEREASSLL
jgi:hypothetical protein